MTGKQFLDEKRAPLADWSIAVEIRAAIQRAVAQAEAERLPQPPSTPYSYGQTATKSPCLLKTMRLKEQLSQLVGILSHRQVGNTHLMLHGAWDTAVPAGSVCIIWPTVAHSKHIKYSNSYSSKSTVHHVGLDCLERLRGTNGPVALDHTAILQLCNDALGAINTLEEELTMRKNQVTYHDPRA